MRFTMRCLLLLIGGLVWVSAPARAQKFDYYVFTLSWAPEFCHENPSNKTPECDASARPRFVVHGLWPNLNDGTDPKNCPKTPYKASAVPPGMDNVMPSNIFRHEWTKHGVCSGMAETAYFNKIATLYKGLTIPINSDGADQQISPADLRTKLAAANPGSPANSFAIQDSGKFLVSIEMCLNKSFQPMTCPKPGDTRTTPVTIRGRP